LADQPDQEAFCSSFNFGPSLSSNQPVRILVEEILKHWPGRWKDCAEPGSVHEASLLNLATDKAFHLLGWQPRWNFAETIERTVSWYRQEQQNRTSGDRQAKLRELTRQQIRDYSTP
jgi:CDP-glucose 4,6-dehydratase